MVNNHQMNFSTLDQMNIINIDAYLLADEMRAKSQGPYPARLN
jgi:hypothetical protein